MEGKKSMLSLAQRMVSNFCSGVCASSVHKWDKLVVGDMNEDVRILTRRSMNDPGEPAGILLSASTSMWLPVARQRLFDFLRDERLRSEWDILSPSGMMQEMVHIPKGHACGNYVSLLRSSVSDTTDILVDKSMIDHFSELQCYVANGNVIALQAVNGNANESSMLILQEAWNDPTGSLVVYAPVDVSSMRLVMNGGDSTFVAFLPSGFAILPDRSFSHGGPSNGSGTLGERDGDGSDGGGSLLTVGFQIYVNNLPSAKLTVESVETVKNLITCTTQRIRAALQLT